jgi:4-hydroxyacetophenone monooxygenase
MAPSFPASKPIVADDAFLAAALERASVPTLVMSLVHITGDPSLLRGPIRPQPAVMSEVQGYLTEQEQAQIRAQALEILKDYRDRGCSLPPPPTPELVREMMSYLVGQPVPTEYVPMMLEEMALDGRDARDVDFSAIPAEVRRRLRVLVIGAGMSGLLAAIKLEQAGIPYLVVEKNDAVGGTWYENRYPGCRVDIANHFYCYSFEPSHQWSEFFSQQPELREYFERCSVKYNIRDKIRFRTEVALARFDEGASQWSVALRSADGSVETIAVAAIVSAVGQLNRPKLPELEGRDAFRGPAFHSARWEPQHDLRGKRVAVVGTGASAFQLVPEVAKQAERLFVFQRSAPWMAANPYYHTRVSDEKKWLLEHLPFYGRWYRFLLFWPGSDGLWPSLVVDPDWTDPERSVNAANDFMRQLFIENMREQLGGDEDLLTKVTPPYPPFGKRMLQDNGVWLAALKGPNVELVTEPIARITQSGIVCPDGREIPVDVIVYATGFHANKFLWPMRIVGRGGVELGEVWRDDPQAYLGITVPRFPNLFCLYGPGTNLAHAGSIIFHSECQVRYVTGCLKALLERDCATMECKQDVHDAYIERFDAQHRRMVWSHPGMTSWYKNEHGRVTTTSPWRLVDYWAWTREPDLADFDLVASVKPTS